MLTWFVIYPPLPVCYVHIWGWGCSRNLDNVSFISTFTVPKSCNYYQSKAALPSGICDLRLNWLTYLGPLVYC